MALSATAQSAWAAYLAMATSKRDYFAYLSRLDERQDARPTIAETLKLEQLLGIHNEKVKLFSKAMAQVTRPADKQALLTKMQKAAETASLH